MYLEVSPEVAGIAESFATEIALVWLHAHVSHEMDMKFGRRNESLGAHGALPLPFLTVARSMIAAVPLAGEVVMDVTAQMGLKLCVGSAFLSTVTDVHIWVFRDSCNPKAFLLIRHTIPSHTQNICWPTL